MDRLLNKLVWLVVAAPAVYLAIAWKKMPSVVAVHFDWSGKPDRLGSKNEFLTMLIILSVVNLAVYFLLTNIYRIDPKKKAAENKTRLKRLAFGVTVFMSALICFLIYSGANRSMHFNSGLIFAGTGLLFAFMGNYMHNIKPNYFAGFRLPWTLENEDNWKRTHALAGKMWFIGGLLVAIACLLLPPKPGMIVFFAIMTVLVIVPVIYSYRLFAKQKHSSTV